MWSIRAISAWCRITVHGIMCQEVRRISPIRVYPIIRGHGIMCVMALRTLAITALRGTAERSTWMRPAIWDTAHRDGTLFLEVWSTGISSA